MEAHEDRHGPQWREAMVILRDLWTISAEWTEIHPLAEMARDAAVVLSARIAVADEEEAPRKSAAPSTRRTASSPASNRS